MEGREPQQIARHVRSFEAVAARLKGTTISDFMVSALVAHDAKNYEILSRIIAQTALRLNVMDLKILHGPAPLTTPAVWLQDYPAKLTINFRGKSQSLGKDVRQH